MIITTLVKMFVLEVKSQCIDYSVYLRGRKGFFYLPSYLVMKTREKRLTHRKHVDKQILIADIVIRFINV